MAIEDSAQLAFPVKISFGSQVAVSFSRAFRLFRYSSWIQILHMVWFWAQCGLLAITGWYLQLHSVIISSAVGSFPGDQIHPLSLVWNYYYVAIGIFVTTYFLSVLMARFGKLGIVPYVFALTFLLQIAIVRICISPILLLTQ